MRKFYLFALAALLAVATSCTARLMDFTVISTKNYPLGEKVAIKKADHRVAGENSTPIILWFFSLSTPSLKQAIDNAIGQYPGAVGLADGVVYEKSVWFVLGGKNSYIVEGTPLYPAD